MNQCLAWVLPLGVSILLGACGGGEDQTAIEAAATRKTGAAILDAQAIEQLQAVAEAHLERKQALAAVPGADPVAAATRLFEVGESQFRQYFPSRQTNRVLPGLIYRYYPETGAYLAVIDWRVFVLGGPFGPLVIDVGELTKYVSVATPTSSLTTQQLANCPTVSGSSAPNFYLCMVGNLIGRQAFVDVPCEFRITSDGTFSLESAGTRVAITGGQPVGFTSFSKASTYIIATVNTPSGVSPSVDIDIDMDSVPGIPIGNSVGTMQVDAVSSDYRTTPTTRKALSCKFSIARS